MSSQVGATVGDAGSRFIRSFRGGGISAPDSSLSSSQAHKVEKGQTLSRIAKYWTGDANRWKDILEPDPDQLADPNKIDVGQVLEIPVTRLPSANS